MYKLLPLIFLLISTQRLSSQSISPILLSPAGSWVDTQNSQLSWSLGEMMTNTLENNNSILTQGFEQSWIIIVDDISVPELEEFSFKLFPNPTAHFVTLKKMGAENESFLYQLCDVQGKEISSAVFSEPTYEIDLTNVPSGAYFISIFLKTGDLYKTMQVQKLR